MRKVALSRISEFPPNGGIAEFPSNEESPSNGGIAESSSNKESNDDLSFGNKLLNNHSQPIYMKRSTTGLKLSSGALEEYTYQAENSNEDVLVSAASLLYGFQLKNNISFPIQPSL